MNGKQYELFGGTPPHQVDSPTSRAAAQAIEPQVTTLAARVYSFIAAQGLKGATDHEIQQALNMKVSTQVPRRRELVLKGLVYDGGATRATGTGRPATVWLAGKGSPLSKRKDWKGYVIALNGRIGDALELLQAKVDIGFVSQETFDEVKEALYPKGKR